MNNQVNNQALLDAVNKAIAALEDVKRELERQESAEPASVRQSVPAAVPEPVYAPEPERPVPQTTQLMKKAASLASAVCAQWKFQDEIGNIVDASLLQYSAGEQDEAGTVDPDDPKSYYIVSPDGAIGLTENDGGSVEWLFLPLTRTVASLPKTLKKGEPWPEAIPAPAASAASVTPRPAPAAPQPAPAAYQPASAPSFAAAPSPQASAPSAPAGNVCPKCGKPFSPGSKFCMGCGSPLQAAAPAPAQAAPAAPQGKFCLNCGAPLQPGDKFCMKCGTKT